MPRNYLVQCQSRHALPQQKTDTSAQKSMVIRSNVHSTSKITLSLIKMTFVFMEDGRMLGLDLRRLAVRQQNATFPSQGKKEDMSFCRIFKNCERKKRVKTNGKVLLSKWPF